jgi:hypothetical protein
MTVLQTLYVLFKGDTSNLKVATKEATKDTNVLTAALKTSDIAAKNVGLSFSLFVRSATRAVLALASVGTILSGIKFATVFSADLYEAADALDVNSESLAAWGLLVDKTGGNLSAFEQTLQAVASTLGKTNSEILETLPDLAALFESLPKETAVRVGHKLGVDDATIRLLLKGRQAVLDYLEAQKKYTVGLEESGRISEDFRQQLKTNENEFHLIFRTMSDLLLPVFTQFLKLIENVTSFLNEHPNLIKALTIAFGGLAAAAALVITAGTIFLTVFNPIGLLITGIVAAAAALAVVLEDVYGYFHGLSSVTGDFVNSIMWLGRALQNSIIDKLEYIKDLWNSFNGALENLPFGKGYEATITSQGNAYRNQLNVPALAQPGLTLIGGGSSSDSKTVNINGPITVTTQATDAKGVAEGLWNSLKTGINQAVSTFTDGVRA